MNSLIYAHNLVFFAIKGDLFSHSERVTEFWLDIEELFVTSIQNNLPKINIIVFTMSFLLVTMPAAGGDCRFFAGQDF